MADILNYQPNNPTPTKHPDGREAGVAQGGAGQGQGGEEGKEGRSVGAGCLCVCLPACVLCFGWLAACLCLLSCLSLSLSVFCLFCLFMFDLITTTRSVGALCLACLSVCLSVCLSFFPSVCLSVARQASHLNQTTTPYPPPPQKKNRWASWRSSSRPWRSGARRRPRPAPSSSP